MATRERGVLERAVVSVAEQARSADDLVDLAATGDREDVVLAAKRLRLRLLEVKGAIERELATFTLDCKACNMTVRWVAVSACLRDTGHTENPLHMASRL